MERFRQPWNASIRWVATAKADLGSPSYRRFQPANRRCSSLLWVPGRPIHEIKKKTDQREVVGPSYQDGYDQFQA
ncbi:MAG: hypothetical protein ACI97A_000272 [Planctomycetota bacterium]|jgi:hypothetical protein